MRLGRACAVAVALSVMSACGPDYNDATVRTDRNWSLQEVDMSAHFAVSPWGDQEYEATDMRFLPDGRALLITKGGWGGPGVGTVNLLGADGTFIRKLLDVPVCSDNERGLLGIEIDPEFESTRLIYLFYTRQMSDCAITPGTAFDGLHPVYNRVSSFVFSEAGIDPGTESVIVDNLPGHQSSHNAGGLAWMPDGTLLVAVGEGTFRRSEDLDFAGGKILRVDPHDPSKTPAGNPFTGAQSDVARMVYALGFRNPFRIAVSPFDGDVVAADVGTNDFEEVDVVKPGLDYGFPRVEGPTSEGDPSGPAFWYKHPSGCVSIIGGPFISPTLLGLNGGSWVTFSDLNCGGIWAVSLRGQRADALVRIAPKLDVAPASLVAGPDGSIYVVPIGSGPQKVRRVAPVAS